MEMESDAEGTAVEGESTSTPFAPLPVGGASTTAGSSLASGSGPGSSASSANGGCSELTDLGDEGGQGDDGPGGEDAVPDEGDDGPGGEDVVPDEGDDDGVDGSSSEAGSDEESDRDSDEDEGWSTLSEDEEDGSSSDGKDDMMASGDEGGGGELHPMKNPVILTNLFSLCPPSLLANFRLVCKEWRDLSLESWRSSITLRFGHNQWGRVVLLVDDDDYAGVTVSLKEFLKYVKAPKNHCALKPFRRFHLEGFTFPLSDDDEDEDSGRIRKLWELVKRDAKILSMEMCSFRDVGVFREVIYRDCPTLQKLELERCPIGNPPPSLKELYAGAGAMGILLLWKPPVKEPIPAGVYPEQVHLRSLVIELEDLEKFPLSWLELFSQFPNLSRLRLALLPNMPDSDSDSDDEEEGVESVSVSDLRPMLEAIQTLRQRDPRKVPLKKVDLSPSVDISHYQTKIDEIFSLILELKFPISAFKLCMDGVSQGKLDELAGLEEIDGNPLRSLILYKSEGRVSTYRFPFSTPLENLGTLVMHGFIWENMRFLKLLPNLERLEITDSLPGSEQYRDNNKSLAMISKTRSRGLGDTRLLKMAHFTCNYALTEDKLRRLANWFPNLTHLHMVLNDKLFAIVCEHWLDLELLDVIGSNLTDEGVTGLGAGQIVEDLDTMELPPNIRLLHYLTVVRYRESEKLSDVSIFNGFLKLPHLHFLHLGKTKELSKRAKAALRKKGNIHFLQL